MVLAFESIAELEFPEGQYPSILVNAWSSGSDTIRIQGITKRGTFQTLLTPTTDRVSTSLTFSVPDIPLGLTLNQLNNSLKRGQLYADVYLKFAGFLSIPLCSGYITPERPLAYPQGPMEDSPLERGFIINYLGTNPAAGAEVSETMSTNSRRALKALKVVLVTDGTVANRQVTFTIDDGTTVIYQTDPGPAHTAGLTKTYFLIASDRPDETAFDLNNEVRLYVPPSVVASLPESYRIKSVTTAIVAGDDWAAPHYQVEEWIEQ